LPDPVRTAPIDTTGLLDSICVAFVPISRKSAPAASASDALCITYSWLTSE
jgi:hypothetical protein